MVAPRFFPISLSPYNRFVKRLMFGRGSLAMASFRQEILCPEETKRVNPPLFLSGQLDRVTGTSKHQTLEYEIKSMLASEYKHAATIAYHVRNAVLYDGSVYAGNYRHYLSPRGLNRHSGETHYLKSGALVSSPVGIKYFGHWLHDDSLTYLLAQNSGAPLCVTTPEWTHKKSYAKYFDQDWSPTDRAIIDDLVIYQDHAQNSLKRSRYAILRNRIRNQFSEGDRQSLVYLRRGRSGISRVVENEDLIIDVLSGHHGFRVLDIEEDVDKIQSVLSNARIVVSMEGSNIAHFCVAYSERCGLLVLQPPDRFSAVHHEWSAGLGVTFGFVVGEKMESGYRFSTDEILRTIELMDSRIGSQEL